MILRLVAVLAVYAIAFGLFIGGFFLAVDAMVEDIDRAPLFTPAMLQ